MLKPQGYGVTKIDGVVVEEQDTWTCGHCNSVRFVKPGIIVDAIKCTRCDRYCCAPGECSVVFNDVTGRLEGGCFPFERQLEIVERRDRLRRAAG